MDKPEVFVLTPEVKKMLLESVASGIAEGDAEEDLEELDREIDESPLDPLQSEGRGVG